MAKKSTSVKLDEVDRKIINTLIDDSRQSLRAVAKKVGTSTVTVMNRLKILEKNKLIKKYTLLPDYEKAGLDLPVLIDLRIAKGKLFEVEKKIATHPNVIAVYDVTGHYDAQIVARFKSRKAMDNFLKKIQTFDFIERTETRLILHVIKEGVVRV